ncbi:ribosome-associated protein [Leclercia adecarboxylata]|uniref:Ribosomal silencing factor RsfS n=1 Tax=Leclercia adecarboxylata TaxID=83655 RepID=A0A4U9HP19_9ENTR|nr:ribosome-associated protein [Leclercia adecarboxylata]
MQGKALQDFVIDKIDDLKGQDIIAIDVQGKSSITDCMIICTGTSTRHVASIADHVVQESRAAGMLPLGVEGEATADWVVVDLGDVIVHVMQEESRRLYEAGKTLGLMREAATGSRRHKNARLGTNRVYRISASFSEGYAV